MSEIINKIAQSNLETIDLELLYPEGERVLFDIEPWLFEGLLLKEKDFRSFVSDHDWLQYKGKYLALYCSSDAIIPSWAYMLISVKAAECCKGVVIGGLQALETSIFQEVIASFNIEPYKNKPVIVKGCSNKPVPPTAYIQLIHKLMPVVKSVFYGEACSTVPLYKK